MAPTNRLRRASLLALLCTAGLGLAACSSSSSSSTTTTSGTVGSSGSNASSASQLQDLSASVKAAQKSSFKAVYTSTTGGSTTTYTLEQAPPKQLFSSSGGSQGSAELLNTGTATYTCFANSSSGTTCTSLGSTGSNALSGILDIYDGSAELSAMTSWQALVAAHTVGASLTLSSDTIAGQPVKCAKWVYQGSTTTYCVTTGGVLAKVATSGGTGNSTNFALISYSSSAPDSDFAVPANATVVTLPTGVSVP